jgi:myosin heavy subunit
LPCGQKPSRTQGSSFLGATHSRLQVHREGMAVETESSLQILLAQSESLRSIRTEGLDQYTQLVERLQSELAGVLDRERVLIAKLHNSEQREVAAVAEAAQLRQQVDRDRTAAATAAKRAAWDSRKREEATAASAAMAVAKAEQAEKEASSALSRQATLLKQRERELQSAQAQVRALKHRVSELALQERQAAWLGKHEDVSPQDSEKAGEAAAAGDHEQPHVDTDGVTAEPVRRSAVPVVEARQASLSTLQERFIASIVL